MSGDDTKIISVHMPQTAEEIKKKGKEGIGMYEHPISQMTWREEDPEQKQKLEDEILDLLGKTKDLSATQIVALLADKKRRGEETVYENTRDTLRVAKEILEIFAEEEQETRPATLEFEVEGERKAFEVEYSEGTPTITVECDDLWAVLPDEGPITLPDGAPVAVRVQISYKAEAKVDEMRMSRGRTKREHEVVSKKHIEMTVFSRAELEEEIKTVRHKGARTLELGLYRAMWERRASEPEGTVGSRRAETNTRYGALNQQPGTRVSSRNYLRDSQYLYWDLMDGTLECVPEVEKFEIGRNLNGALLIAYKTYGFEQGAFVKDAPDGEFVSAVSKARGLRVDQGSEQLHKYLFFDEESAQVAYKEVCDWVTFRIKEES